jgi:hypothetical protein
VREEEGKPLIHTNTVEGFFGNYILDVGRTRSDIAPDRAADRGEVRHG